MLHAGARSFDLGCAYAGAFRRVTCADAVHPHRGNVFVELAQKIFRAFFWLRLYKIPTLTRG